MINLFTLPIFLFFRKNIQVRLRSQQQSDVDDLKLWNFIKEIQNLRCTTKNSVFAKVFVEWVLFIFWEKSIDNT